MLATAAAVGGCSGNEEAARTVTTTATSSNPVTETSAAATDTAALEGETGNSGQGDDAENGLRFRGAGDESLPPFRVMRRGTILRWTNTGEVFSLFGSTGTIVDSVAPQGEAVLPAGVQRIDVVASGQWVIEIPGARRLR
ncbi:MAG: hypothetical protein M3304_01405 [Actinomycetota bacterium]|nr:hypothetical protein [Actinomycetota bacterium]